MVSVSDGHVRSVAYDYTADGLLEVVHDVAGNSWRHVYGTDRRLTEAVGANGEPFLLVDYDESGRVEESRSGREYSFDYEGRKTTVTEGTGYRHTFEQSHTGATRSFASTTGISWRLEFDGENRVRSVAHQGGRHALDLRRGRIHRLDDGNRRHTRRRGIQLRRLGKTDDRAVGRRMA